MIIISDKMKIKIYNNLLNENNKLKKENKNLDDKN